MAPDYSGLDPIEIPWEKFKDKWIPYLEKEGLLVGVNWSGKDVSGFDLQPSFVIKAVEAQIAVTEVSDDT